VISADRRRVAGSCPVVLRQLLDQAQRPWFSRQSQLQQSISASIESLIFLLA